MSVALLKRRLARLEANSLAANGPCPREAVPTVVLSYRAGEDPPPIPENAAVCDVCGDVHPLYIKEVVVATRDEVLALAEARRLKAEGPGSECWRTRKRPVLAVEGRPLVPFPDAIC